MLDSAAIASAWNMDLLVAKGVVASMAICTQEVDVLHCSILVTQRMHCGAMAAAARQLE